MELETRDLILRKAGYEDWEPHNVWSRPQTAEFMMWRVTANEDEARERMKRTLAWQAVHDAWLVCEKCSGQPVGFAGVEEIAPHVFEDTGIALGPEYVGRGYGKQILRLLTEYCRFLGGQEFYYTHAREISRQRRWHAPVGLFLCVRSRKKMRETGSPMSWKFTGKI